MLLGTQVLFETKSLADAGQTAEDIIQALEERRIVLSPDDHSKFVERWKKFAIELERISTLEVIRKCFEGLALAEAAEQDSLGPYMVFVEKLLRKFEITRNVYCEYDVKSFTATSKQALSKEEYAVLSALLFQAYRLTQDIRFLNAILKIDSTSTFICSRVDQVIAVL